MLLFNFMPAIKLNGSGLFMKKKICALVMVLMLIPVLCFAYRYNPRSAGLVVDNSFRVLAVNINGLAYRRGIRPGDVITQIQVNNTVLTSEEAMKYIESTDDVTYIIKYQHKGVDQPSVTMQNERMKDLADRTTFLVLGNAEENYATLVKTLTFNPNLTALFPVQSSDKDLKTLRTYSNINDRVAKGISQYVITPGGEGLGLNEVETLGNFAVIDEPMNGCTLLKMNFNFHVNYSYLFGTSSMNCETSGMLEKKVIHCMFDNNLGIKAP